MIRPINAYILVKFQEFEEQITKGKVVLPVSVAEGKGMARGEVIAVGYGRRSADGSTKIPQEVSVGDTVLYNYFRGSNLLIEGEQHTILEPEEIFAVIEPEPTPIVRELERAAESGELSGPAPH